MISILTNMIQIMTFAIIEQPWCLLHFDKWSSKHPAVLHFHLVLHDKKKDIISKLYLTMCSMKCVQIIIETLVVTFHLCDANSHSSTLFVQHIVLDAINYKNKKKTTHTPSNLAPLADVSRQCVSEVMRLTRTFQLDPRLSSLMKKSLH